MSTPLPASMLAIRAPRLLAAPLWAFQSGGGKIRDEYYVIAAARLRGARRGRAALRVGRHPRVEGQLHPRRRSQAR